MSETASEKSIFLHAANLATSAERSVYLEEICSDPVRRARIAALLSAHDRLGGDIPLEIGPARPVLEAGHLVAGRFKLLELIGDGGMGSVWRAEQTDPVRRTVAVKLIKAGLDSKSVLARFEAERQALAIMDHPNIAKVLDGGLTDDGRPFIVMELVQGIPITKYCDEHQLTPRQRLELYVPVCQAIQHAHQKGIIHRDIKPSNVLVTRYDERPVPKVIDFGVAKATGPQLNEKDHPTGFGYVVGTVEYMSPEQASCNQLDVDTRSDIYSLGVLLYELLAGTPPFSQKELENVGMMEMLRVIREQEPSKPSTKLSAAQALPSLAAKRGMEPSRLTQSVRGELDWIVMKALEKDRNRRYETANGMALDVQRYLHQEPVHAHPPSVSYRFHKFVRRNKGPVLAASLVLLALVAGIVGTTVGLVRADQQRQIAETNEHKASAAAEAEKQASEKAQTREAEAKAVLDFMEKRIIAAARPEGQAGGLGREVTLRKALEVALQEVGSTFAAQPLIEARLRFTLSTSFANLGDLKIALEQVERTRELRTKHLGHDHPDTLACTHNLANCYYAAGLHSEALKLREETLALMKAKLGFDDPLTLMAMSNLAVSYATIGERDKALKLSEETLALKKAKLGPDDPSTLGSMNNLAGLYSGLGQHDQALKLGQETVKRTEARHGPKNRATLTSMDTLAMIYHNRGEFGEAVKLYELALPLMKDKLGPAQSVTLACMMGLANSYAALDRHSEELRLREEMVTLRQANYAPDHPNTIECLNYLAGFLATCHDPKFRDPKRAVELAKRSVERAPRSEWSLQVLGWARYRTGDWKESITALGKSLELRKDGGDSFNWFYLAMAYWRFEDKGAARLWYNRAVEWMEKHLPKDQRLIRLRAEADELMNNKPK